MRTGSIGNRDAETLVNTLPEPKKSILQSIERELVSLGYTEEAGFDAINIESYLSYSLQGKTRFFLKHKWEVLALLVLYSESEKKFVVEKFPALSMKSFEVEDVGYTMKFDPKEEKGDLVRVAEFFSNLESGPEET
jgi:hypothetical protein